MTNSLAFIFPTRMHSNLALALLASLLGVLPTASANLYTKNSPVLQVDHKTYDSLIAKSNYTSVRYLTPNV